jgi:putative intracellular protease/amidase
MRVAIVIYDGFDELDALGPFEVLWNAAAVAAEMEHTRQGEVWSAAAGAR